MPERTDMIDLEAAYLEALETVASEQCAVACAFGLRLAEHPLGLEITAHGGVGRQRRVTSRQGGAQVVEMQLHGPTGMLAVLGGQVRDGGGREAGETANVGTQAVLQDRDRIDRTTGGVVPALQRRGAEADVQAGGRMPPGFGGDAGQGGTQLAGSGRGSQQGANDREAQARPTIAFEWIDNSAQEGLPKRRRRRHHNWEEDYKASWKSPIRILCV